MKIWVDADACPVVMREILFRASERTSTELVLVANTPVKTPPSAYIRFRQVEPGFDVADNEIARLCQPGDLVVTGDIPLASEVIDKGCIALGTRGELFTPENIRARLNMRDFMDTLRSSGVNTGGAPPLGQAERQAFANQLDRLLAREKKKHET